MSEPIATGEIRISYPHLHTPDKGVNGSEPSYNLTALIPKQDAETKQRLYSAIQQAYQEGIAGVWKGIQPPNCSYTLYDGDGTTPSGEPWTEECRGHWVLRCKSSQPPTVFDAACKPITNAAEVYGGCYGSALVHFYPYAVSGNKGIGCGLDGFQKWRDGEPFGGRVDATKYFQPRVQPAFPQQVAAPAGSLGYPAQQTIAYAPPPVQYQQPAMPAQQPIDPITGKPVVGNIIGM